MKQYLYKGNTYSMRELAEISGIKYTTLAERLKRGYTVEEAVCGNTRVPESIIQFDKHSDYTDWNGLVSDQLYKFYISWCLKHHFNVEAKVHFTRCIKRLHPNIRFVPTRLKLYGGVVYKRIVRVDCY